MDQYLMLSQTFIWHAGIIVNYDEKDLIYFMFEII